MHRDRKDYLLLNATPEFLKRKPLPMPISFTKPPSADTTAFRIYSQEPIAIDTFDQHWLVQTRDCGLPQWILEQNEPRSIWWKRLEQENRKPPTPVAGQALVEPFVATEHGARFEIDFQAGYSQGIFLDQRLNRQSVRQRVQSGDRVLNTFAYTCAFSVVAALAGATLTSLDLSKNYLEWGKRNFQHNGLEPSDHFFTKGDTHAWLRRWLKSGVRFEGIILDPPTFSRNEKGKVFRVEKDVGDLVALSAELVNPGGWILGSTNYRGLDSARFEGIIREALRNRPVKLESRAMPPEFRGEDYLKTVWIEL